MGRLSYASRTLKKREVLPMTGSILQVGSTEGAVQKRVEDGKITGGRGRGREDPVCCAYGMGICASGHMLKCMIYVLDD